MPTFVFKAGAEYKPLHKNLLEEMCMATPAIADDHLILRALTKLHCFRKAK